MEIAPRRNIFATKMCAVSGISGISSIDCAACYHVGSSSADGMIVIIALHTAALLTPPLCATWHTTEDLTITTGMPFFRLLDRTIQDSHPVSLSQATLVDPLLSMSTILYLGDDRTAKRRLCPVPIVSANLRLIYKPNITAYTAQPRRSLALLEREGGNIENNCSANQQFAQKITSRFSNLVNKYLRATKV